MKLHLGCGEKIVVPEINDSRYQETGLEKPFALPLGGCYEVRLWKRGEAYRAVSWNLWNMRCLLRRNDTKVRKIRALALGSQKHD